MAVTFNVNDNSLLAYAKIGHKSSDISHGDYAKLINAVEIDWNGAVLSDGNPSTGGATNAISDTSQLLELINSMQKEIYVLTAAVIALASK